MKCCNALCDNEVPEDWGGGYCTQCLQDIAMSEGENEEYEVDIEEGVTDPYEEYGFDHGWELD